MLNFDVKKYNLYEVWPGTLKSDHDHCLRVLLHGCVANYAKVRVIFFNPEYRKREVD